MRKFFERYGMYIAVVAVGAVLTPAAIRTATLQRGYKAIGGEYLIIPLSILIVFFAQEVKQMLRELKKIVEV